MGGSSSPTYNQAGLSNLANVSGNNIPTNFGVGESGYNASQNAIDSLAGQGAYAQKAAQGGVTWDQLLEANSSAPIAAGGQYNNTIQPYVSAALQTGFDPQKALYAKQFQQQQDQNAASAAASGVSTSPYGAGLAQQANQNFDINWQNQQLARQNQAAQTASTLTGAGMGALSSGFGTAANLAQTGENALSTGAGTLQSLYQALASMGQGQTSTSTQAGQALLNAINQAYGNTNQAYSNSVANQQVQNQQQSQGLGGIGSLLGTIIGKLT
jgi:hypothetical protein